MSTHVAQDLSAERLPLTPTSADQDAAAAVTVARRAHDKADLLLLLDTLGLPQGEDDIPRLLPYLPDPPADHLTGDEDPMTTDTDAFKAVALSMYYADSPIPDIVQATGLHKDEIKALVDAHEPADADAGDPTVDVSEAASADNGVEMLLAWAEQHALAGIRSRAARIRSDLADLTDRRASEHAVGEAEARVAKLKAELEHAQADLRQVKAGGGRPIAAAPLAAPGQVSKRSKDELAAIRAWARAGGHQVADRGLPAKPVLDAYDAAHRHTVHPDEA